MSYHLTTGWATFGQAVEQGFASSGLKVGALTTQTDVKTRWGDSSIRFAVVTAKITSESDYAITAATIAGGTITPTIPSVVVTLTIGGTAYLASVSAATSDLWLNGPLVKEFRSVLTPTTAGAVAHGFLKVYFDIRVYNDNDARVDVTVENTVDESDATSVTYDVDISIGGGSVFSQASVTHYWATRWRKIFGVSFAESSITPDFEFFHDSFALLPYLDIVASTVSEPVGALYEILQKGALHNPMNDVGGRWEIAPYPDWVARYLIHKDLTQKSFVLANGDLAGSWPVHIRNSDGTLINIDIRTHYWFDTRAQTGNKPVANMAAMGSLLPDLAHQPSLGFVPYLITGDRYYADELAFWAVFCLIETYDDPGSPSTTRNGAEGLLRSNQPRGVGWALRNMAEACAYWPDADSTYKAMMADKIQNNLDWLDGLAATPGPLGPVWIKDRRDVGVRIRAALWEHTYLAYAIHRTNQHGFIGATDYRDQIVQFQLDLFTNDPDWEIEYASPYEIDIGTQPSTMFTTLAQCYAASVSKGPAQFAGLRGPEARLMLMLAQEQELEGADEAYEYLWPFIGVAIYTNGMSDLAYRSGWALDVMTPAAPPSPTATLSVSAPTAPAGSSVTVTWANIPSAISTDWAGLFLATANDSSAIDWLYVNGTKTATIAVASGNCPFTIPKKLRTGNYQFRIFRGLTHDRLADPVAIAVAGKKVGLRI